MRPSTTTSGTEPHGRAMTGVPHAIASIITRPNGSGQSIGNSSAWAPPRNAGFSASPISPRNSTSGSSSSGAITRSKYSWSAGSTLAAILSGSPTRSRDLDGEVGRFSGEIRPRNAR